MKVSACLNKNYQLFIFRGQIFYESPVTDLIFQDNKVRGIYLSEEKIEADAVILASGGFEANENYVNHTLEMIG